MKSRKILLVSLLVFLATSFAFSQTPLDTLIDEAIDFARIQLENTLVEIGHDSTIHPSETIDTNHKWLIEGYKSCDSWWTSGYFSACYWYMFQLSGEEKWRIHAVGLRGDPVWRRRGAAVAQHPAAEEGPRSSAAPGRGPGRGLRW